MSSPQLSNWPEGRNTLGISAVAKLLEVHRTTLWKWVKYGVQDTHGQTVKLAAERVGGAWKIDKLGLRRFLLLCRGEDPARHVADPDEAARCAAQMRASHARKRP